MKVARAIVWVILVTGKNEIGGASVAEGSSNGCGDAAAILSTYYWTLNPLFWLILLFQCSLHMETEPRQDSFSF